MVVISVIVGSLTISEEDDLTSLGDDLPVLQHYHGGRHGGGHRGQGSASHQDHRMGDAGQEEVLSSLNDVFLHCEVLLVSPDVD